PNDRTAHFHLGRVRANQAEYDEAIQHFLKTLTPEDESTPRSLYALAATYARAGNSEEALRYARTAREQAAARGQAELLASIERDFQALAKRGRPRNHEQAPCLPGAHGGCSQHRRSPRSAVPRHRHRRGP